MSTQARAVVLSALIVLIACPALFSQSRHNSKGESSSEGSILSVVARRTDSKTDAIRPADLSLYENGIEQRIRNFSFDPSPSRIVILVDNSQTLPITVEKMKEAVMNFAYEIYDGDQIFVVAYDEKPEIIQEWTDDPKKLELSLGTLRKKGNPFLFDAIGASVKEVLTPLMPGTRKTALVMIGDGLDRGSTTHYDKLLTDLQNMNVTVYSMQIPDRTGGAYRRDQPKASVIMSQLAEDTGGIVFPFEDAQTAAKTICDELRKDRYLLSYVSANSSSYDARRLLLIAGDGISLRVKASQPPNVK